MKSLLARVNGLLLLPLALAGCTHTVARCDPRVANFPPCNNCQTLPPNVRLAPTPTLPQGAIPSQSYQPVQPVVPPTPQNWVPAPPQQTETPSVRLLPPRMPESPRPQLEPQLKSDTTLPVDIPGFAEVRKGLATGYKPLAEGVTWLADNGYRAVLHIRLPGSNDDAARRQFESKGLRYLSLEVSPKTLDQATVEKFNALIDEAGNRPLFVYDQDGALAGGMWYLYFRVVEQMNHTRALELASRHGLSPESEVGLHREMLLAVQKYLSMEPMSVRGQRQAGPWRLAVRPVK